ncbi:hypothetical protein D3C87_1902380 [compost metagenome]
MGQLPAQIIDPFPVMGFRFHDQDRYGQVVEVDDIRLAQLPGNNFFYNVACSEGNQPFVSFIEASQQTVEAD